ncbi:sulfonate ABC transporter ATP-binding protein [Parafrankia colletiae]|uniref:Sulfonate ABC transporter ATP-binding protein n=1 Tax=Parafrankia colletiae TaxID=573497 RepID=A0A1S1QW20_9ACTN|nr:sulfonate ABC transporter ATP-binding protein [Parafrankia colletiae]
MSKTTVAPTPAPAPAPAVRVSGLRRSYGSTVVLDNLDLTVADGEFVCLLGRSGCGKTTLLRTLAGLDKADVGVVDVPDRVAVVFQEPRLLPWKRVGFNVRYGLPNNRESAARAQAALAEVGLDTHADAWPKSLSGGQAQRVALARALVREPQLLLLDEPFASLDALTRITMQGLIRDLAERHGAAAVLVTHDVDEAILLGHRVLVMDGGAFTYEVDTSEAGRSHRGSTPYEALRRDLLKHLGVEET